MRVMHMLHSLDAEVGSVASTVRKGFKWADLQQGEDIKLCVCSGPCKDIGACGYDIDTMSQGALLDADGNAVSWSCSNCTIEGIGHVGALWFGRFRDVPARLLRFEHEVRSRQYDGLLTSMRKAYGADFSDDAPVTVVVYMRTS